MALVATTTPLSAVPIHTGESYDGGGTVCRRCGSKTDMTSVSPAI
jgi:hypothetical protein